MAFNITNSSKTLNATLRSVVAPVIQEYTISYVALVEEQIDVYPNRYTTTSLTEVVDAYTITYSSFYGDVVADYTIRYYSGRELVEGISRYSVRYTSSYPDYSSDIYSIKFTSTSPNTLSFRSIYRVFYDSAGSDEVTLNYVVRYTKEYFKDRLQEYYIRYDSETPFMFETKAVLLRNASKTSVLFCLRGRAESLSDMLLVFSNLPRYQLVEFDTVTTRPNIKFVPDTIQSYNLFGEAFEDVSAYTTYTYILVENIEEVNALSLDVYEKTSLEKRNFNKSFFFNLEPTEFYTNAVTVGGSNYTVVNYSSEYYNYEYLNFLEKRLKPVFKVFDSCCFSIKITDTTSSGACSPF